MTRAARRRLVRARLRRIREQLEWVDGETVFINLESYRRNGVKPEIRAILRTWAPEVLAGCEAIGNNLPQVPGYVLIHTSQDVDRSRANVFAYVRDDLPLNGHRYLDLRGTWPRTNRPAETHEHRAYLVLEVGRSQMIVAHQPPKNARGAWILQHEGVAALARAMAPWKREEWRSARPLAARVIARLRPRLLTWDSNRRSGEAGPGPDSLALRIGGTVHGGERVDNALTRGQIKIRRTAKRARVAGLKLDTDHGGAIRVRWAIRAYWLPIKE